MRFDQQLYLSDSLKGKLRKIKWKLNHNAGQFNLFVIVLPENEEQLAFFHCAFLQQPYYKKHPPYVLGIADGRAEALRLIQDMVMEVYNRTGTFEIKRYFETRAGLHNTKKTKNK